MSLDEKTKENLETFSLALKKMMADKNKYREQDKEKKLDAWFKYHSPTADDTKKYEKINNAARDFARVIFEECLPGKDQEQALWLIRQARMTGNASIACKGV